MSKNNKGEIKIRLGNENQEPMLVYLLGWSKQYKWWICEKINTSETVFSSGRNLIDFDYHKFRMLYYEWKINRQDKIKQNLIKALDELKKSNKK